MIARRNEPRSTPAVATTSERPEPAAAPPAVSVAEIPAPASTPAPHEAPASDVPAAVSPSKPSAARPKASKPAKADCNPPTYIGADGFKHYKANCL
jgi:hypothetical protein